MTEPTAITAVIVDMEPGDASGAQHRVRLAFVGEHKTYLVVELARFDARELAAAIVEVPYHPSTIPLGSGATIRDRRDAAEDRADDTR